MCFFENDSGFAISVHDLRFLGFALQNLMLLNQYSLQKLASMNRMGLSLAMLDSKLAMVIWLREIPVMFCILKNTKFSTLLQLFCYICLNKNEGLFHRLPLGATYAQSRNNGIEIMGYISFR